MFVKYYKLSEQPFGVTPNPRFLYLTPSHREAMASIYYGVMENRGFTALIAPPGMGKTTLLFDLLQRFGESMRTVFLFQFQPSPEGLLRNLLSELGIADEGENFAGMQEKLNQAILQEAKRGKRIVVVVDEAQNFREPVLEVLRMLSNFETSQDKLIHIILSGQPQLAEMLTSPSIEQLRQRISIVAALQPLTVGQTREYIEHRLRVAGYSSTKPLFSPTACDLISEYSGGIPRTINNLCFNAMSLGCASRLATISRDTVNEVIRDLELTPVASAPTRSKGANLSEGWFPHEGATGYVPKQSAGRGLRVAAGVASFVAALFIGGVFANQYLHGSRAGNSVPAERSEATQATVAQAPVAEEPSVSSPTASSSVASDVASERQKVAVEETPTTETPTAATSTAETRKREVAKGNLPAPRQNLRPVKLVTVSGPESLYGLCVRNMNDCDARTLREIRELNPWLHDPKLLREGQKIRMPLEIPATRGQK